MVGESESIDLLVSAGSGKSKGLVGVLTLIDTIAVGATIFISLIMIVLSTYSCSYAKRQQLAAEVG